MHVWRDVLWSSFTDELTKIANVNAGAKAMRMSRPRPLKIKPAGNMYPATGYQGPMSTTPNMVKPRMFQAPPGATMQAPSLTVTGAGPVSSMPTNMPNPLTSGNIPPLQSSGPMNMMNIGKY